jgi:hypothetical protein
MTLCPIAVVAGCRKCPAFAVCPLKGVLGDQNEPEDKPEPKVEPGKRTGQKK